MLTKASPVDREELYEDKRFPEQDLAALVVSKVYYHLGEYEESMMFALGAGELFDISVRTEYEDTIICTYPSSYCCVTLFLSRPRG